MREQIVEIIETLVRDSLTIIINSSLNVCKEFLKFILILLILYYITMWSFQLFHEMFPIMQERSELLVTSEKKDNFQIDLGLEAPQVIDETYLRIGAPDENLIKQRASLLEQLEIEAEFEDNIKNSEDNSERNILNDVQADALRLELNNTDEVVPLNYVFISQIDQESNETSRPSQTVKTGLGKKSKLRENTENVPTATTDGHDDQEQVEIETDVNSSPPAPEDKQI